MNSTKYLLYFFLQVLCLKSFPAACNGRSVITAATSPPPMSSTGSRPELGWCLYCKNQNIYSHSVMRREYNISIMNHFTVA